MSKLRTLAVSAALLLLAGAAAALVARQIGARPSVGACIDPAPQAASALQPWRAQAVDGNCLQGYAWLPAGRPVQAALVVVHGIHDHARRYAALALSLNEQGVAVYALDHRGHGHSGGARQRVDSAAQLMQDAQLALREAAARHPGVPLFLHGHSMGGMVAAHLAAQASARPAAVAAATTPLAGVILSSAALKLPAAASPGTLRVLGLLGEFVPSLPLEAVDESQLVRDAAGRAELAADTEISRDKLPARSVVTVLQGIVGIQSRLQDITLPLLILHGSADQVTDPAGSRELAERARSQHKTLKIYPGLLHDLLHEPEQAEVRREIAAFIAARIAPAKPA